MDAGLGQGQSWGEESARVLATPDSPGAACGLRSTSGGAWGYMECNLETSRLKSIYFGSKVTWIFVFAEIMY